VSVSKQAGPGLALDARSFKSGPFRTRALLQGWRENERNPAFGAVAQSPPLAGFVVVRAG
jgi:hypothetical protein